MAQLEDPIDEAFARLGALEFAVEVLMANELARMSIEASAQFKEDFVRVSKKGYGPLTGDETLARQMQAIARRSEEIAKRLIEKVARREIDIRGR